MGEVRVDTVRLQRISKAFWESAALMSAVELDVFSAIADGHYSLDAVASHCGISVLNAERLLVVLTALNLIERETLVETQTSAPKRGERFHNAPDVQRFLVRSSPSYAGPWMLFGKPRWQGWGALTEHLRRPDSSIVRLGMYDADFTPERARTYHEATYSVGMGAARLFHRQVSLEGRRRIMDLGGGSGCYCIVAARAHPAMTGVVLDLPSVVVVTREFIAQHDLATRLSAEVCDFTTDPLPMDADVAIMASNLPQYGRDIVASVVQRVFDALLPGGEFHLIGECSDSDGTGPLAPALWGLSEAVNGSSGLAHSTADCERYFREAGFTRVTVNTFIPETLTRITGYKPEEGTA